MRGYYYDQDDLRPAVRPAPPSPRARRRRGGGTAVVLFLCTLLLLIGSTALLSAWNAVDLAEVEAQFRQEGRQPASGGGETDDKQPPPATTVERAPTGDGTTLTISALPQGEAHSFQQIYQENMVLFLLK